MNLILSSIGASLTILWGIAHLIPTKGVIEKFGDISKDNQRILAMEWINEGVTLVFLGILTFIGMIIQKGVPVSYINFSVSGMLIVLALISLNTGFKVNFIPYKLCPLIFTISAIFLFLGAII